jgi:1-acyl-sn-glycerol-3-phosphate acyltransferase
MAGWAVFLFTMTMIVFYPLFMALLMFGGNKGLSFSLKMSRAWAWVVFNGMGVRLKVKDNFKGDKSKAYLIIANHSSHADIPVAALSSPLNFRFLAKAELKKFPVFGYLMDKLYILVDRKKIRDRAYSLNRIKESIDNGHSVLIFPEGTRNKKRDSLLPFKDSVFRLAEEHQIPIICLSIDGSHQIHHPDDGFMARPSKVKCTVDGPISLTADYSKTRDKVHALISKRIGYQ